MVRSPENNITPFPNNKERVWVRGGRALRILNKATQEPGSVTPQQIELAKKDFMEMARDAFPEDFKKSKNKTTT